jgi:hypothetical protein
LVTLQGGKPDADGKVSGVRVLLTGSKRAARERANQHMAELSRMTMPFNGEVLEVEMRTFNAVDVRNAGTTKEGDWSLPARNMWKDSTFAVDAVVNLAGLNKRVRPDNLDVRFVFEVGTASW